MEDDTQRYASALETAPKRKRDALVHYSLAAAFGIGFALSFGDAEAAKHFRDSADYYLFKNRLAKKE